MAKGRTGADGRPEIVDFLLVVHTLTDGRLLPSFLHRTWRGRVAWDKRVGPPYAIETPPPPPAGVDQLVWTLYVCALDAVTRSVENYGAPRGAGSAPLDRGRGVDRLGDVQLPLWPIPSDLVSPPPPREQPASEASRPFEG